MLSRRFFRFIAFLQNINRRLGISSATFDTHKLQVTTPKPTVKIIFNAFCIALWIAFHFIQLCRYSVARDYSKFNIVATFTITNVLLSVGFAVGTYFGEGWANVTNSILIYLPRVNSKKLRIFQNKIIKLIINF